MTEVEQAGAQAYFALLEASVRLFGAVDRHLRREGNITHAQFEILTKLSTQSDGMRMTDLADVLLISPSGLTYQVAQLERRCLLSRARSSKDDRVVLVRTTPAAHDLIEQLVPGHIALVRSAFAGIASENDLSTLTRILIEITKAIRTIGS